MTPEEILDKMAPDFDDESGTFFRGSTVLFLLEEYGKMQYNAAIEEASKKATAYMHIVFEDKHPFERPRVNTASILTLKK
jgi:hypothetical protein